MPAHQPLIDFYENDFSSTLFPLDTNRLLVTQHTEAVANFVYQEILISGTHQFLPQMRVYASKPGFHVRRTVKLDPVAEFFVYDIIFRNRATFRRDFNPSRRNFGYLFANGGVVSSGESHRHFKMQVVQASQQFNYWAKFDISSYFNSVYHHDLVTWFREDANRTNDDIEAFGKFFREINAGRSLDCLPQGITPCKMIGSHFLKYVDNSARLQSELLLRFMDDFYLFSNNERAVIEDFTLIQRLLGDKGLSINPMKTKIGQVAVADIRRNVDAIRGRLLQRRNDIVEASGVEETEETTDEEAQSILSQAEVEYLLDLLRNNDIEEEDAELVLALMRDHSSDIVGYLEDFLVRFPNLSRQIYYFCRYIDDTNDLRVILSRLLSQPNYLSEYQLFWMAKIVQDYLLLTPQVGEVIIGLLDHPNASQISKAKLLEIPERRFGLPEVRLEHIRTGSSDWLVDQPGRKDRSGFDCSRSRVIVSLKTRISNPWRSHPTILPG